MSNQKPWNERNSGEDDPNQAAMDPNAVSWTPGAPVQSQQGYQQPNYQQQYYQQYNPNQQTYNQGYQGQFNPYQQQQYSNQQNSYQNQQYSNQQNTYQSQQYQQPRYEQPKDEPEVATRTMDDLKKSTANIQMPKIIKKTGGIKLGAKPISISAKPVAPKPEPEGPKAEEPKENGDDEEPKEAENDEPQADAEKPAEGIEPEVQVEEQEEEEEEEEDVAVEEEKIELPPADPREHMNLVTIGHVDAGKSTLSGSILYWMGSVDDRTIEKFKKEAKETNRESWFLAFIMDTNEEERAKGKTVEVGRAQFCTEKKRYTMLDAPGHKNYVPAMIQGAAQADVGILVISARKGEFEAGFDRSGQTREHAMLARTLGVQKLIVVINKMDESTVQWSEKRYEECVKKLTPYLKQCGFKVKKQVVFLPISAMSGENVREPVKKEVAPWAISINDNKSLIQILDEIELQGRDEEAPFRMPVLDRYIDRGLNVMGKIEAGYVTVGQKIRIAPTNKLSTVEAILAYITSKENAGQLEQAEVSVARVGDNVVLRLKDCGEDELVKGFVLSSRVKPLKACFSFVCQLQLLELLPHRALFTAGYQCVLHAHTAIEECTIVKLLREMDPNTGKPKSEIIGGTKENPRFATPRFVKSGAVVWCRVKCENLVCVEPFKDMMPLGRFTLRDEGKTIAIGKVIKVDERPN